MAKLKTLLLPTKQQKDFINRLSRMEHEARTLELYETAIVINAALQKLGYEVEYVMKKQTKTIKV